ncbi:ABC transporter ATP-binding protein [Pumilibacter intestinalis]|uniref:ABC transporter ATP-binding protein n=1 Tax=Pumilibacter intestinalis TaxID=2941511 RepID=UPI0020405B2D|nr:ABC transporter ATP-binding protein [Pumilibacter intestinalis]MCI8487899.1 ABC transporter ATP-binding protein [Clostridia bacterium]
MAEKSVKFDEGAQKGALKFDKIIEVRNITKTFDDGVTVVDNMNLSIKRGDFVTLLGPSGCGKTTLLRMIAGFTSPTSGKIFLEGKDVTDLPPHKRPINTVFQKYALFPHLNVFKNIAFGLKLKKIPDVKRDRKTGEPIIDPQSGNHIEVSRKFTKREIEEKVNRVLGLVGLSGYGHRDVSSLSGGQQQRVAIARALVLEPKVLLLDEPLGALDLKMRKEMQFELKKMHDELGITFIYVTHDQEEALTMSDKVVVISDGVIQQMGTPKKIYDEPANAFVANFIGESNILTGEMPEDYKVRFCGGVFKCEDRGFEKNEKVDLVVRPEDIFVFAAGSGKGQLTGAVTSVVFKGTYYEMNVATAEYEFTVQSTESFAVGSRVELMIKPDGIHIMKKTRTVNETITAVDGENTVDFHGGSFEFVNSAGLEKGDRVKVSVAFDKIELTDDERDGVIGGNIGQSLYKGTYYQVQVYTDDDDDIYVDTADEWDIDDRVGIVIKPEDLRVEKCEGEEEEQAETAAEEAQ